jgi:hypothetical protein
MTPPEKLKSPSLNEDIAGEIKGLWLYTPLNQAQIAAQLGAINQGRVSEVINGHRFRNVAPKHNIVWSHP